MTAAERTGWVVEQARALGFDLCGVTAVEDYIAGLEHLPEWLERGYAGEMRYLHDSRRADPARVLPGAGSLIVCALNYNPRLPYSTEVPPASCGWISRYAWGDDYHEILGAKLESLMAAMRVHFAEPFEARAYVDTGPIVERVAAKHAGLGWLAKNTCLINEQLGSWLFLGVIVTTLDLAPSLGFAETPPPDLCGNCRQCIDACPTGAIVEPYVLDARRCISYLTIELRGSIPEELREPMGRMVFGCDICQDVCPWNRNAAVTREPRFLPRTFAQENGKEKKENGGRPAARQTQNSAFSSPASPRQETIENRQSSFGNCGSSTSSTSLFNPSLEFLASLTEADFREMFRGSAIKRTKWRGLVRNACIALGNSGPYRQHPAGELSSASADNFPEEKRRQDAGGTLARIVDLLERLAASDDAVIAEHARWALGRLRPKPLSGDSG